MSKRIKRMKSVDSSHENKRDRIQFEENQVFIKKKWTRKGIIAVIVEQSKRDNWGELFNPIFKKSEKKSRFMLTNS